jgi:hypothetical protein
MAHLKIGKCKHFNGIQHPACDAGVKYKPFLLQKGQTTRPELPCFSPMDDPNSQRCNKREDPTAEEIATEKEQHEAGMNRLRIALIALSPIRKELKGKGGQGQFPCPVGCGGTLRWSMARSNGHMHGQCSTPGCVSWME